MWLRTLKIYSLKFQIYNTVLLTIVTILYIRPPELIHLKTLYPLTNISPFPPCPAPYPQPLATTVVLSSSMSSTYLVPHLSEIIHYLSFCVWLISLIIRSSRFIHIISNGRISSFLWLNNILLYIHISHFLYSFICQWKLSLFPYLGYCE